MIIIGEKLNGSIPSVARAVAERDEAWIQQMARKEAEAGADFIDVCASVETREAETLVWMLEQIESVTDTPISIDSPSTEVLAEVYRFCKRPGLFNSISMESGKQIDRVFQIMAEHPGWEAVAMLCDDGGIPDSVSGRLRVFSEIMGKAEAYGIAPSRIHIDPIVEAAALMDPDRAEGPGIAVVTKVMDEIRSQYLSVHITSAISNISYGLPARKYMNYSFAVLALSHGLDSGILNPLDPGMPAVVSAAEKLLRLPQEVFAGVAEAARENRLGDLNLPLPESGLPAEMARAYTEMAAVILSMKLFRAGAEAMRPKERKRKLSGVIYAAASLLGLEEEGSCMEYVRAYRDREF